MNRVADDGPLRLLYGITASSAVETLLRGQLGYMRRKGWEVHVVANDSPQTREALTREAVEHFHPVAMSRAITPLKDCLALVRWVKVLWQVKPHAVNVSSPKAGLLGIMASWICRVPTRVYVLRGARFETMTGATRRVLVALEWFATRCATETLAISESLRRLYVAERITPVNRIHVLQQGSSNGVAAETLIRRFQENDRESARRRLLGTADGSYVVLYLGRVAPDKGVTDLASAMLEDDLADAVLLVVGEVEDDLDNWALSRLRGEGRLAQHSHTDDITEAFAAADVLCLPSHREGLGNVLIEASAVGLPVVGTRVTGVVDAILPGRTGLIAEARSPRSLASALAKVKNDPLLAQRLGSAGAEWVIGAFQPERIWEDLDATYRKRV